MVEMPYLVDTNVLLRWVRPDNSDYPAIVSVIDAVLRRDGVLCYTFARYPDIVAVNPRTASSP